MKVVVTGGVMFNNRPFIWSRLDMVHEKRPITALAERGMKGTEQIAYDWGVENDIKLHSFARNPHHKYSAIELNNNRMLSEFKPDLIIAFPGVDKEDHLVWAAETLGIPVVYPMKEFYKEMD